MNIGLPREAMHWQFGEMEFGEMKRDTSNWSNFGMLLRRESLTASAGLSCFYDMSENPQHIINAIIPLLTTPMWHNIQCESKNPPLRDLTFFIFFTSG